MSRVFAVVLLIAVVAMTAFVVDASLDREAPATDTVVPACAEVDAATPSERVTCTTANATLVIAPEGEAVPVGRTGARVLRSRLDGRTLVVRLRLRRAPNAGRARIGRRQLYVRTAGDRIDPEPLFGGREEQGTQTLSVRFRLTPRQARRLRTGKARADLGIVPNGQLGREQPRRLGVVRLDPAIAS